MVRGEVKAQSTLTRFTAMKQEEKRKPDERRPFPASHCRDLAGADSRCSDILREIGNMILIGRSRCGMCLVQFLTEIKSHRYCNNPSS